MKDWILYNWNIFAYGIALVAGCVGLILINERLNKIDPEYLKVQIQCLELTRKIEGIELNPKKAKFIPVGVRAKQASYSGIMMVWDKEISGISVKCSVISNGNRIKLYEVNGEDKTNIAIREGRER